MINSFVLTALSIATLIGAAQSQSHCPKNDHWVDAARLPYRQGELHPCQYAGTMNVSVPGADHHLFYWLFRHADAKAPLLVWLNGGPGATSMFGLFLENGPLRVQRNGTGPDDFVLKAADAAWTDKYSVVFIDQPVGTGFSYGDSVLTSMLDGSQEFVHFLIEFLEKYPEFRENGQIFMTGESYAGKYLPLFTSDILAWNRKMEKQPEMQIPIQGTFIIDPYPSPVIQRTHMHIVPKALGLLDANNLDQIASLEQKCEYYQTFNASRGKDDCNNIMNYIEAVSGGVFQYDGRIFDYDWNAIEAPYVDMMMKSSQMELIYDLIHISNSTKRPVFDGWGSDEVGEGYRDDNLIDYSQYYNELIESNYPLIVMAGEFDMQDGIAGQYIWMKKLLKVSQNFWKQARQVYYFTSGATSQTLVGGYWITEGSFSLLTAPKSGHFIPANYYEASRSYLDDFVEHQALQCHAESCKVTDQMCSFMNNCSNNGVCNAEGQCQCYHSQFKGADCSKVVNNNHDTIFFGIGTQWAYFTPDLVGDNWRFVLTSTQPFDVYISQREGADSNPNQFNFDSQFLNVTPGRNFTITPGILRHDGPFVVAMKSNAYDFATNTPLNFKARYHSYYDNGNDLLDDAEVGRAALAALANIQELKKESESDDTGSFASLKGGLPPLLFMFCLGMITIKMAQACQHRCGKYANGESHGAGVSSNQHQGRLQHHAYQVNSGSETSMSDRNSNALV